MTAAQKAICGAGLCAVILLLLFPPWQQAYKSFNIPFRRDIGHSFILKQPTPVEVRSVGTVDPRLLFMCSLMQEDSYFNALELWS